MKKTLLLILGDLLLFLFLGFVSHVDAAAVNTDPASPLANKDFTVGYSGVTQNCIIFRVLSNKDYIHRESSGGIGAPCDDDGKNYMSTSRRSSDPESGLVIFEGLEAGGYKILLLSKEIKNNNFDSKTSLLATITITVQESEISPTPTLAAIKYNCSNRPPNCPASTFPGCAESSTICKGAVGTICGFSEAVTGGQIFCAYPPGVTPGVSAGNCAISSSDGSPPPNSCSAGYSPIIRTSEDSLRSECVCWPNSLPSPPPLSNKDGSPPKAEADPPPCGNKIEKDGCKSIFSAFGTFKTDPQGFLTRLFSILLSLSGGIALLFIIRSGYQLMTSQGDPEKVKEARERITSAIVGLLFIVFSLVILEVIGVDILAIPGLSR